MPGQGLIEQVSVTDSGSARNVSSCVSDRAIGNHAPVPGPEEATRGLQCPTISHTCRPAQPTRRVSVPGRINSVQNDAKRAGIDPVFNKIRHLRRILHPAPCLIAVHLCSDCRRFGTFRAQDLSGAWDLSCRCRIGYKHSCLCPSGAGLLPDRDLGWFPFEHHNARGPLSN